MGKRLTCLFTRSHVYSTWNRILPTINARKILQRFKEDAEATQRCIERRKERYKFFEYRTETYYQGIWPVRKYPSWSTKVSARNSPLTFVAWRILHKHLAHLYWTKSTHTTVTIVYCTTTTSYRIPTELILHTTVSPPYTYRAPTVSQQYSTVVLSYSNRILLCLNLQYPTVPLPYSTITHRISATNSGSALLSSFTTVHSIGERSSERKYTRHRLMKLL